MTRELLTALEGTGDTAESPPCLKGGAPVLTLGRGDASAADDASPVSPADGQNPPPALRRETQGPLGKGAIEAAPDPELDALYRHFEGLRAQTQALGREIPDFDPALALRDPDFLRLTAPGVGMDPRRAWLALHPELLERRAARESAAALARSLASSAARPREGGGGAGATLAADYRSLPRAEQQRLKERILQAASRGEKIYP